MFVRLIRHIFILFFLLQVGYVSLLAKNPNKIRISPLPMDDPVKTTKIFSPLIRHVSQLAGKDLELIYQSGYDDILDSLNKNTLDLAYLGPLPFATIRLKNPNIIPLVGFYEGMGLKGYTCVLARASFDAIDFKRLANKKLALTQPLSTCGYFMASKLLRSIDANLSIEDMRYKYIGTHTGVAKSILRGEFLIGSLKDSIATKYSNVGLEIIATSKLLPSFILVANENTLNKELILEIKRGLLRTPKSIYSTWEKRFSRGMFEVSREDFDEIIEFLKEMKIPKKGNF